MEAVGSSPSRARAGLRALIGILVGVVLAYTIGALATALIVPWVQGSGGVLEEQLLRKGPHRLMGRLSMVSLVLIMPFLVRAIGWKGRRDMGFVADDKPWSASRSLREIGKGVLIGIVSLSIAIAAMLAAGTRVLEPQLVASDIPLDMLTVLVSCIVVALLEETIARGIIFRSLARVWTPLRAALLLSVLFALAHFLRPLPEAFTNGPPLKVTGQVLLSMFDGYVQTQDVLIRTANLTLMSLVLCAFVYRTGTIWLAVGAHAAWVWIKRMNGKLTDSVYDASAASSFIGHKSDATDSPLATVILLALFLWALLSIKRAQRDRPI